MPIALLLVAYSAAAETEIFRCAQADGTIAFQEMPCSEIEEKQAEPAPQDLAPISEVPVSQVPVEEPLPPPASKNRSECEKAARDAIDAIDLEMRSKSYSKEEGQAYLAELRVLTRQLRACKQL
ncbi:MAG: hypothetical protein AAFN50_05640 [Pseudomonadota bacterium]